MTTLLAGLIVFLGIHSIHLFAPGWRDKQIAWIGLLPWKGLYSVVSIIGFVLIIRGFGLARHDAGQVWLPPVGMHHATELFTLLAALLITATYVPRNALKTSLHHPMVLGAASWALGHLLANGSAADVLLFAAFLVWGVVSFVVDRRRDITNGTQYPASTARGTLVTIVVGVVVWVVFAFWLHGPLIGVRPFG
jgi:uncharacterized membrane protein